MEWLSSGVWAGDGDGDAAREVELEFRVLTGILRQRKFQATANIQPATATAHHSDAFVKHHTSFNGLQVSIKDSARAGRPSDITNHPRTTQIFLSLAAGTLLSRLLYLSTQTSRIRR